MLGAFHSAKIHPESRADPEEKKYCISTHTSTHRTSFEGSKVLGAQRVIIAIKELNPDSYVAQLIPRL